MFSLYQIVHFGSTTGIVSSVDGRFVQIMWEENTHDVSFVTWSASKWRNSLRGVLIMVWQVTYCFSYGGKRVVFVEADSSELAWAKSKFQLTSKEQRSISRSGIKQVEEG